jgi:hypothetical protein
MLAIHQMTQFKYDAYSASSPNSATSSITFAILCSLDTTLLFFPRWKQCTDRGPCKKGRKCELTAFRTEKDHTHNRIENRTQSNFGTFHQIPLIVIFSLSPSYASAHIRKVNARDDVFTKIGKFQCRQTMNEHFRSILFRIHSNKKKTPHRFANDGGRKRKENRFTLCWTCGLVISSLAKRRMVSQGSETQRGWFLLSFE